jgi:hypothetical protein
LANKIRLVPLALALLAAAPRPAAAELLKLSLLAKPAPRFTLRIDLFRGADPAPGPGSAPAAGAAVAPAQAEALQRTIAEEIAQSVSYEGFILKNSRRLALLNVSGEFFAVGEGDAVLGKIKILAITRERVTIEYDGQPYEIRIKGDLNG